MSARATAWRRTLIPRSTPHPTPYAPHSTPYTLHPTPHTLHPTPYTVHLTPYTLHPGPVVQVLCLDDRTPKTWTETGELSLHGYSLRLES